MKKFLFTSALSSIVLAGGLVSCSSEDITLNDGTREVELTVTLSRENDATRSILSEENGNLNCVWEASDEVLVTDAGGHKLGVLKVRDGANTAKATFSGSLTLAAMANGNQQFNFIYLGKNAGNVISTPDPTVLSYAVQDGTLAACSAADFFTASTTVTVAGGSAYVDEMGLARSTAFGHFELKFPENVTYTDEDVKISGKGVNNSVTLTLTNNLTFNKGNITVTGTRDFYITLLPAPGEPVEPEFRVVIDGKVWKGALGARQINASDFLRLSNGTGVPVRMELTDEDPDAVDPGDFDNWGGSVDYPSVSLGSFAKIGLSKDAWCHNYYTDVDEDFGFAAPLEYKYNAIKNGYLTSASYGDGQEAKYFQWGRWLGFPKGAVYATVSYFGGFAMNESLVKYPRGINQNTFQLYYCWNMDTRACYAWMTDTGWSKQQAINSSIIFGVNEYDYLADQGDCKWEDRSGNPCPDGYRIPKMSELEVFAPSVEQFNGTYAEVKEIAGNSYAIKWTVEGNSVRIQSVPTSKSTVEANDPIFNDAKEVVLEANGMLYCEFPNSISDAPSAKFATSFDGGWKTSGYWTNESAAWADGKFGGVALMVRIKGTTAKIGMEIAERTAGLCIIPVKSETAKATPIKPWFPLGY